MNKTEKAMIKEGLKDLSDSLARLKGRIKDSLPVEFDCPVCKHKTLAKDIIISSEFRFTNTVTATTNFHVPVINYWDTFSMFGKYCYTCGNTFEKKDTTEWVKVKKEEK